MSRLNRFPSLFTTPSKPKIRRKWRIHYVLWSALKRTAMAIGFLILFSALISGLMAGIIARESGVAPSLNDKVVLYLPLKDSWVEHEDQLSISQGLEGRHLPLRRVVDAIERAAVDPRVKGIVASYQGGHYSPAQLYEVRQALAKFTASGKKFSYFFGTDIGGAGGGLSTYYLASAFHDIWLQPAGTLSMMGVSAEMPFLRGLMDKVGVEPNFFQRKEYKLLFESLERTDMSKPSRDETTALVNGLADYMVSAIAKSRNMTAAQVKTLINQGLFTDQEALDAGLVTQLNYGDVLLSTIRQKLTGNPDSRDVDFVNVGQYAALAGPMPRKALKPIAAQDAGITAKGAAPQSVQELSKQDQKDAAEITADLKNMPPMPQTPKGDGNTRSEDSIAVKSGKAETPQKVAQEEPRKRHYPKHPEVALIYTVGAISQDESGMGGGALSSAQGVSNAIMQAVRDKDIHAIVLRIDSPGGSPTASETIRRALERAQEKGKKVIVSMGATTASGGYWIASTADYIFATPMTLTGSIGVAGGKVSLAELWKKIGVNWDGVQYGDNADMFSFNQKFDKAETARFNALMDNIYDNFLTRVAEGRHMSMKDADLIARGRVWLGGMALNVGLVDALGGLNDALDYTARQLGAQDRYDLQVVVLPRPKTAVERITELLAKQVGFVDMIDARLGGAQNIETMLAPLSAAAEDARVYQSSPVVTYEPLRVK